MERLLIKTDEYNGRYVAMKSFDDPTIVGVGDDPETALKDAVSKGDTGADECALPASFVAMLGHNLQEGKPKKISTGNGITTAYGHTTRIKVEGFTTQDVVIDFMPNLNIPLLGVKSFWATLS